MKDDERFTRADVALLVLLAGLVALFFWRILTPNAADRAQFPAGDFTDQFYAFRLYEARAFSEGRIPLWSENFNSGHPFLADIQSAVFYPPALLNTLLNVALFQSFSLFALELEALLHFYLAGAFTYLFARRALMRGQGGSLRRATVTAGAVGMARVGAFVSALVFTFGGYLTSYPSLQLAILETAAWMPLALYCLERAAEGRRQTIDGRQETVDDVVSQEHPLPVVARPSSAFVIERLVRPRWLIAAGMVLGVAALAGHPQTFFFVVAVCTIYFVWRVAQESPAVLRQSPSALRVLGSVTLLLLIAFGIAAIHWIPAVEYQQLSTREALSFADAASGFPTLDVLQFILPGYASAFASPLYVGILPLWLALFALLRKRNETIFWGLLALGALLLAFGFYVFAYVVFYLFVPGASLFRGQERLAFVVSFALAMLAGYGIVDLVAGVNIQRARRLFFLLPAGAGLTLVLLLTFFVAGAQNPDGRLGFLGDRAGLMLLQFALASLVVGLYLRDVISVKWFVPLAIVLILFDLWSVGEPGNKGRVQDRFGDVAFAEQLRKQDGVFRVSADEQLLPGHFGIATGLEEVGGISPLRLARYDELLALPPEIYLPLLNVDYIITRRGGFQEADVVAREGDMELRKLRISRPRAWLVGSAIAEPDAARAADLVQQIDPRQSAILPGVEFGVFEQRATEGEVLIPSRSAERMTLDVNTPADGLLVISENYYPGWYAAVDGQPAEILRANLTLRAIPVPAGQHRVEMWYDPLSFKLGAAITVITLLVCVGALVLLRRE